MKGGGLVLNESETGSSGVDSGLGCAKELFPCISNCLSSPYRFLIVYRCHTALGNSYHPGGVCGVGFSKAFRCRVLLKSE